MQNVGRHLIYRSGLTLKRNSLATPEKFVHTKIITMKVKELRIILTVDNLQEVIQFYRNTLGLEVSKEWNEPTGSGIILDAGRASLELIDKRHAETIDENEG